MAALKWSSPGVLRSPVWLRSLFVWLLLTLLLTGAASYTSGSRYAIVPGSRPGPVQRRAGRQGSAAHKRKPQPVPLRLHRRPRSQPAPYTAPRHHAGLKKSKRTAANGAMRPAANQPR